MLFGLLELLFFMEKQTFLLSFLLSCHLGQPTLSGSFASQELLHGSCAMLANCMFLGTWAYQRASQ